MQADDIHRRLSRIHRELRIMKWILAATIVCTYFLLFRMVFGW